MDYGSPSFWPALISKGLRRHPFTNTGYQEFLACPDFKGIKTTLDGSLNGLFGFWPALISKGLRHYVRLAAIEVFGFWPALISKGLRRLVPQQLCVPCVSGLP